MSAGRLLNVQELSEYLSLPSATIYTWVSLGRIPGVVRLGRALRFDRGEIDGWVESMKTKAVENGENVRHKKAPGRSECDV